MARLYAISGTSPSNLATLYSDKTFSLLLLYGTRTDANERAQQNKNFSNPLPVKMKRAHLGIAAPEAYGW